MAFQRRILRYGPTPDELVETLDDRVIAGCTFTLQRVGGCGDGKLRLRDSFAARAGLAVGTWIACEYEEGDRWYLGRITERITESPAGMTLILAGMSQALDQVFPGGFGSESDQRPHRYALTDMFSDDPDREIETVDVVERPEDVVRLLLTQYVVPATPIAYVPELVEDATVIADLASLKFHGEESVSSILKDLALRVQHASWGVNEAGQFYFLQSRSELLATHQEGSDILDLRETVSHDQIYNRVLLTGGYVYGTGGTARWRANYRLPASIADYGEHRFKLWIPWIRSATDSRQFVQAFFDVYAEPAHQYRVEVAGQTACPRPWLGRVRILDIAGDELVCAQPEKMLVHFDHTPRITFELGPINPRNLWPAAPQDERYPQEALSELPPDVSESEWLSSGGSSTSFASSLGSEETDSDLTSGSELTSSGSTLTSSASGGGDTSDSDTGASTIISDSLASTSTIGSPSGFESDSSDPWTDVSSDDTSTEIPPPWSGPDSSEGGGGSGWSGTGSL